MEVPIHCGLVQLAERMSLKHDVTGSSPVSAANYTRADEVDRRDPENVGSNPIHEEQSLWSSSGLGHRAYHQGASKDEQVTRGVATRLLVKVYFGMVIAKAKDFID